MTCRIATLLATLFAVAAPAAAQTADLRYRAPVPASVTYVSVDSIRATMSGMPTGDITSTSYFRSVSDLTFSPADSGIDVTLVLKELHGSTETPMGAMPISASDLPPFTFTLREAGPQPEDLAGKPPVPGADPGEMLGAAKAFAGFLALPGRELTLGESWTDTVSFTPELDGVTTEMTTITRGTYAADTVVDGTVLNILRVTSEMTMTMTGSVQGMAMTQRMTAATEERVLWDSERHYVTSRDAAGTTKTETTMSDMGMTMTMNGTTRTITTIRLNE